MTKCPRCFDELTPDWFAWAESGTSSASQDDRATLFSGVPTSLGKMCELRRPPNAAPDWVPQPGYPESQLDGEIEEICPRCHFALPSMWRWGQATCIAMAGARATGKTVFIAVMIKQLQLLGEQLGISVEPANNETARIYSTKYEEPLYEQRGILEATPPMAAGGAQREPLIFVLGQWHGQRRFLVIRDVAGEDLEQANTSGEAWNFFRLADGVLFMFDPLKVEEVSDQLRDLVPVQANRGGDPRQVLRTLMTAFGPGSPKIAVVLSKFDALQSLQAVKGSQWSQIMSNAGAAFSRDPSLNPPPYDTDDGELLHEEVRSLLQRLDAGPMLQSMENPVTGQRYRHRFFAVSALGQSPIGQKLHRSGISPFRCLDPVRWVLAEHGVM